MVRQLSGQERLRKKRVELYEPSPEMLEVLESRIGRNPTKEECFDFVFGTQQEREAIWALGESKG